MHPRYKFLKTLPEGSSLLDANSSGGGLEVFRHWPPPARPDLRMYAYAPSKGPQFDAYDGFELGDWLSVAPRFPEVQFDAIYCSQVIERHDDAAPVLEWIARRLPQAGRLYLEWPSHFSQTLPGRDILARSGITLRVANFEDDPSHRQIHDRSRVATILSKAGMFVEQQGYVSFPFFEDEILAHIGQGLEDPYATQMAYWSKTRWLQYVVAVKW